MTFKIRENRQIDYFVRDGRRFHKVQITPQCHYSLTACHLSGKSGFLIIKSKQAAIGQNLPRYLWKPYTINILCFWFL